MKKRHPDSAYEKLRVWKTLDKGIKDLEANGDIEEKTARPYIVGYLSQLLTQSGLVEETPSPEPPREADAINLGA